MDNHERRGEGPERSELTNVPEILCCQAEAAFLTHLLPPGLAAAFSDERLKVVIFRRAAALFAAQQ